MLKRKIFLTSQNNAEKNYIFALSRYIRKLTNWKKVVYTIIIIIIIIKNENNDNNHVNDDDDDNDDDDNDDNDDDDDKSNHNDIFSSCNERGTKKKILRPHEE